MRPITVTERPVSAFVSYQIPCRGRNFKRQSLLNPDNARSTKLYKDQRSYNRFLTNCRPLPLVLLDFYLLVRIGIICQQCSLTISSDGTVVRSFLSTFSYFYCNHRRHRHHHHHHHRHIFHFFRKWRSLND